MGAFPFDIDRGPLAIGTLIVEGARHQSRRGRLTDTPNARQHVSLSYAARREGIPQGANHWVLANEFGKDLRPVFPRQGSVTACRILCRV
jgi:hypothetical protein